MGANVETEIQTLATPDKFQYNQASYQKEIVQILGWLLTVIAPVLIYYLTPSFEVSGVDKGAKLFLCILSSASIMWIFSLLPEFVPGLFVLLATLLLSLVETPVILSGFASSTFITLLSIAVMTLAIMQSGVIARFLSYCLRHISSVKCAGWILFGFGVIITPILPSIISRSQLFGPVFSEISKSIKLKGDNDKRTLLYASGFFGFTLLSSSFLSASLLNFIIFSLLPLQEQQQFQSKGWIQATLMITAILLVVYMLVFSIFFKSKEKNEKTSYNFILKRDKKELKLKLNEVVSLGSLLVFFVGMLTTSYHKIPISWLALSILFMLLAVGIVKTEDFEKKVDWSYLFYVSSIVGISSTFKVLALDIWLYDLLLSLFPIILYNKILLFVFITVITLLLRLILPVGVVVILLIPTAIAISTKIGINAWTLCFVLLFVGDAWFFPYQCSFYQIYKTAFDKSLINEKKFLKLNASFNLVKLLALFLSLYYWKYLSLI